MRPNAYRGNSLHLDYAAAVFSGVYATDSCFYLSGLVSDTLPPYYPAGILWSKYGYDGGLLEHNTYFKEGQELLNFYTDIEPYRGGFVISAEARKHPGMSANLLYFDQFGEVTEHVEIDYFFPLHDYSFILPTKLAIGPEDKILLPTRERNPVGTNNTETVLQLFDSTGNILWRYNHGLIHNEDLKDFPVEVAAFGSHFIVACWLSNDNKVFKNYDTQNYLFAIDTTGAVLWEYYSPEEVLMREPEALYVEEDGSVIVSTFLGEEFIINASSHGMEWHTNYIYKLNPPNEVEWSVSFEQPYPTIGNLSNLHKIIKATDDSGYVIAGHVTQLDEEEGPDIRGWLLKISPEGDSLWSRRFRYLDPNPQTDFHEFYDLEATPDGGYLMAGQVKWEAGPPPIQQGWLVKVDEWGCLVPGCHLPSSTNEPSQTLQLSLQLYPNPATEAVNIFLKDEHIARRRQAEIRLVDMQGKVLQHHAAGKLDEVTNMLPLYGLAAGPYLLQYVADGEVLCSEKLIVAP